MGGVPQIIDRQRRKRKNSLKGKVAVPEWTQKRGVLPRGIVWAASKEVDRAADCVYLK